MRGVLPAPFGAAGHTGTPGDGARAAGCGHRGEGREHVGATRAPRRRLQRGSLLAGGHRGDGSAHPRRGRPRRADLQPPGERVSPLASTSVYRHFASRDQLMIAIADELDRISLDRLRAAGARAGIPARPGHESLGAPGPPGGSGLVHDPGHARDRQLRAVDAVLEVVHRAGWHGREAVLQYAAFSNCVLSLAAYDAARPRQPVRRGAGGLGRVPPCRPQDVPLRRGGEG